MVVVLFPWDLSSFTRFPLAIVTSKQRVVITVSFSLRVGLQDYMIIGVFNISAKVIKTFKFLTLSNLEGGIQDCCLWSVIAAE